MPHSWITHNFVLQTNSTFRVFAHFQICTASDRRSNDKFVIKIQFCTIWIQFRQIYSFFMLVHSISEEANTNTGMCHSYNPAEIAWLCDYSCCSSASIFTAVIERLKYSAEIRYQCATITVGMKGQSRSSFGHSYLVGRVRIFRRHFLSNDILVIQRSFVDETRARLHNHMVSWFTYFLENRSS